MNEAHIAARPPDRFAADPSGKAGLDPFVKNCAASPSRSISSDHGECTSFALLVVLPVVCTAIYYGLIPPGNIA